MALWFDPPRCGVKRLSASVSNGSHTKRAAGKAVRSLAIMLLASIGLLPTSGVGAGGPALSPSRPQVLRPVTSVDDAFGRYRAGDIAGALQEYLELAAAGDPIAAYNAAAIRLRDESDELDESTALTLLRRSAEAGFALAQYMLGSLYERGELIASDQTEALRWFERAASQGHAEAMLAAGTQHFLGRGTVKDHAQALHWYRRAADSGDGAAAYIAGSMYEHGDGTGIDLRAALQWYAASARQGDEVGRLKAREIAERLAKEAQ